jgi:ABC-type glycerol-3-phosphate transport system permease component
VNKRPGDREATGQGNHARAASSHLVTLSPPHLVTSILLHLFLLATALLILLPFLWLACAAFKPQPDIFTTAFLPWGRLGDLTLDNFRVLFKREPFARWMLNSLFLSSLQTVLVVTLSSLGGFALAKYRFAGRRPLMLLMFLTMLLPAQVIYPSGGIDLVRAIGWVNSYAAIVVPGAVSVFGMFLFMQAMKGVPDELLHAGRVDGCSELRLWWDVALPIVRPMVGAYTLLSFLASWNSFLWPQIVLQDENKFTLPMGLTGMVGVAEYETQYGVLMAGTLLAVLPVLILFFVLQKDFIAGLASGAVKG